MPYDPQTTDFEHLLNIESESIKIDENTNLKQWLVANSVQVKAKFAKIHRQRLEEKFEERFGIKFPGTGEEEQQELKYDYIDIWKSIEKRYLNFDEGVKYHPRILIGVRNILLFENAVSKIKDLEVKVNEHPQTEVISLGKIENNPNAQVQIGYKNASDQSAIFADFSDVVMSTGRWRLKDEPKTKYVSEVWPISEFKSNLLKIIREEIAQRKEGEGKKIKISIQGQSLTAIDAVKTILDGSSEEFKGYDIEIDMLSRSGVMQQVKGLQGWEKQKKFSGKFPLGTEINQEYVKEIAGKQDGKIRLWQVMLMTARALENGYRAEGEELRANQAREFVKIIINNVSRNNSVEISDANLAEIDGSTIAQLEKFQTQFGLQLDGAKYNPIVEEFNKRFLSKTPMEQLRSSLAMAESGDTSSGHLLWKSIYGQIDSLTLASYLNADESAFRFQIIDRTMSAFNNGMPIETAKYLIAKHEAGVLNCRVLGEKSNYNYDENGKVSIKSEAGEIKYYDAVVSSRGYDLDVANNPSDLARSMRSLPGFAINETLWASKAELEKKNKDITERFGEKDSAKMLKKFHRKDGGNFYYSTGDYRRGFLGQYRGEVSKVPAQELIDLEGRPILPGLIIPFSGGVVGAMANGRKVFAEKFSPQQSQSVSSPSVVVTGSEQLQNKKDLEQVLSVG